MKARNLQKIAILGGDFIAFFLEIWQMFLQKNLISLGLFLKKN